MHHCIQCLAHCIQCLAYLINVEQKVGRRKEEEMEGEREEEGRKEKYKSKYTGRIWELITWEGVREKGEKPIRCRHGPSRILLPRR